MHMRVVAHQVSHTSQASTDQSSGCIWLVGWLVGLVGLVGHMGRGKGVSNLLLPLCLPCCFSHPNRLKVVPA